MNLDKTNIYILVNQDFLEILSSIFNLTINLCERRNIL
jgi:hypothetical protein